MERRQSVLEKFYLISDGHKIRILRAFVGVIAGGNTAKLSEIIDEMGLIVIAATGRDIGPVYSIGPLNLADSALKPADTTKYLRCHSNLLVKDLDEAAPTKPDFGSDFLNSDTVWLARETFERVDHGAMTRDKSAPAREQRILEDAKLS